MRGKAPALLVWSTLRNAAPAQIRSLGHMHANVSPVAKEYRMCLRGDWRVRSLAPGQALKSNQKALRPTRTAPFPVLRLQQPCSAWQGAAHLPAGRHALSSGGHASYTGRHTSKPTLLRFAGPQADWQKGRANARPPARRGHRRECRASTGCHIFTAAPPPCPPLTLGPLCRGGGGCVGEVEALLDLLLELGQHGRQRCLLKGIQLPQAQHLGHALRPQQHLGGEVRAVRHNLRREAAGCQSSKDRRGGDVATHNVR